jgi:hypothetical protein
MNKATLWLIIIGFALRLFLIFPGPLESKVSFFTNYADLRNYYWPAQAALHGQNPYQLWATGQSGEFRADMAPLELAVYVATVAIWNDPRALQILFALFDAVNIALLGWVLAKSPLRLPFQLFYAFGPLTVYNLVLVPQDKTILLALTLLIFGLLRLPRHSVLRFTFFNFSPAALIMISAALLAAFKWLSVFYLFPLLLFISRDWRDFIKYGALFGIIVALAHLPWLPDWLYVYTFRAGRTATPSHIALAVLLQRLGLFDKNLLLILLAGSLIVIYALFWFKRIDIFETIALSVMVGILWTPDMDPVHLSIIVLHFLLIVNWASLRWQIIVWGLGAWAALVYAISTRTGFAKYGLPDLRAITGVYGSPQMIVLSYVLFIIVLGKYLMDKRSGQAVGIFIGHSSSAQLVENSVSIIKTADSST